MGKTLVWAVDIQGTHKKKIVGNKFLIRIISQSSIMHMNDLVVRFPNIREWGKFFYWNSSKCIKASHYDSSNWSKVF